MTSIASIPSPPSTDLPTPPRALAIGAHPDDVEFGCGTTLAKWATDGSEVHLLVLTDGSKSTWDPDADIAELVAARRREQHAAAGRLAIEAIVAARDPHFFPESGAAHRPTRLLLFEAEVIDHVEDVHGFVDAKIAALLEHTSQLRSTMGIDAEAPSVTDQRAAFERRVIDEAGAAGALAERALGEAFKLVTEL